MTRIHKVYGIDTPNVLDWSETYKNRKVPEIKITSKRAVGIEVEVENIERKSRLYSGIWTNHADGSLRNNGTEYVSAPIPASIAPNALQELLQEVMNEEQCCFSPRTSIHVHVDVSQEDDAAVLRAITLYSIFEKLLFRFTGRGRSKNIYCVPVIDTDLMNSMLFHNTTSRAHGKWSKYSAMNILPLSQYGTMEFRHMHGTFDASKVSVWIRMLTSMIDYACLMDQKVFMSLLNDLGPNFSFLRLMGDVFQADVEFLKYQGYDEDFSQAVGKLLLARSNPQIVSDLAANRNVKSPYYMAGVN